MSVFERVLYDSLGDSNVVALICMWDVLMFSGSSTSGIQKCQDHIKEKFGALVLDVGDLMKSEVENETPIGLALKSLMLQFKQIPDVSID